ncbi:AAA family ATPase [Pseudarthrobacter sp. J47]|uniref:AAA family ATPase n=1 Tax=Pseudarthrobacter sp. J47 TaxID=3116482 RepID=UPI002E80F1FC|nr:AAA family ATPase [Pseudarthrobacter sp. J47]MEE2524647.1 AAA family ATPase [Pseudarthrobacter sp. J47]
MAIASSRAVLLVGPPGTGKTEILEQIIDEFDKSPQRFGLGREDVTAAWVTPEEEWTFEKVVLGETIIGGELASVEGDLLTSLRKDDWLILDETNRADMDRVLGGVLTWLSGKRVKVGNWRQPGADEGTPVYLDWTDQANSEMREVDNGGPVREYLGGSDWRILGTYNAVDAQRVFRMGQALGRRFKHVPVPPASEEDFRMLITSHIHEMDLAELIQERVTRLYAAHLTVPDAQLGPGLFVDMPSYLEHGLRLIREDVESPASAMAQNPDRPDTPPDFSFLDSTALVAEQDALEHRNLISTDSDRDTSHGLNVLAGQESTFDEMLAEAYLISVGNILAKYEPDLLDDLGVSMMRIQALTPENWRWVTHSLSAMRA